MKKMKGVINSEVGFEKLDLKNIQLASLFCYMGSPNIKATLCFSLKKGTDNNV
jgi:hypothetical protein